MDPSLERPADWYKPGPVEPARAAHGTYRVGQDGDPEVRLFGTWDRSRPSIAHDPEEPFPSIVWGHVWEKVVTLVGCRLKSRRRGLSPQQDTTLTCDYAIEGGAFEPGDLFLTDVHVQLWDQDVWTDADSFKEEHEAVTGPEGSSEAWAVHYVPQSTQEAEFPGGVVRLVDSSRRRSTPGQRGWVLSTESRFEIEFNAPVAIDEIFGSYILPLEFLLVLATGRPSGVRTMLGKNRDWRVMDEPDDPAPWVTFRVGHAPRSDRERWVAHLLHRLEDFNFEKQFGSVFNVVRTHRYSIEHYAALRSGSGGGHLARFVAATQLVESLHRRLAGTTRKDEFHRRLRELDADVGGLVTNAVGTAEWVVYVRDLRNLVIHGLDNADSLTNDVRPLQAGTAMLLLLFEARFLVALGFDAEVAKQLVERRITHKAEVRFIREHFPHLRAFATGKAARATRVPR